MTILDVGANIGLSSLEYQDRFPNAEIHAFEPSPQNFHRMDEVLAGAPGIRRHNCAVGAAPGEVMFRHNPYHPTMSRIGEGEGEEIAVPITSLDAFCERNRIDSVDILKIDTEGYEIEVLAGAEQLMSEQRIALIQLECGLNPDYSNHHIQIERLLAHMFQRGYRLFGLYEQWEWTLDPSPALARADAVFISSAAIAESRRSAG